MKDTSDLIGAELGVGLMVWFLCVLAAFFLVGVVVGIIVLIGGVVALIFLAVGAVRRSETGPDDDPGGPQRR